MNHTSIFKERLAEIADLEKQISGHMMTVRFHEKRDHYIVALPKNSSGLDLVRVSKQAGKANALKLLINKLEELYNGNTVAWVELTA